MTLDKHSIKLFDAVTIPGRVYSSASSGVDLSDAIDFSIGYTMTFAENANYGATIYVFGDPSASDINFTPTLNDDPVDEWDIDGDAHKGTTTSGVIPINHSARYVKVRLFNHDVTGISITNCSIWAIPQRP